MLQEKLQIQLKNMFNVNINEVIINTLVELLQNGLRRKIKMRTEYNNVIRAWLDGAEVEEMHEIWTNGKWQPFCGVWTVPNDTEWQYRIAKPAKEPKYLYVYRAAISEFDGRQMFSSPIFVVNKTDGDDQQLNYLGKIRLEE
jgi:hypothetical protein